MHFNTKSVTLKEIYFLLKINKKHGNAYQCDQLV